MGKTDDVAGVYDDALRMSREAFAQQHYNVAFHALSAALHAAYDLSDEARLSTVGALAHEQCGWLAAHEQEHEPPGELSAPFAAGSGSRSLWDVLCEEVETRQRMLIQRRYLRQITPQGQP